MKEGTRLSYLLFALCFLIGLILLPSMAQRISYSINKGAEQAKREEALAMLKEVPVGSTPIPTIVKAVGPGVVGIRIYNEHDGMLGLGSGVIVDSEGFLITNSHVLNMDEGNDDIQIEIRMNDEKSIVSGVELIGIDFQRDLALLRLTLDKVHPLKWGNSDALEVGEQVLALGNPYGLEHTVTSGIISATRRYEVDPLSKECLVHGDRTKQVPTQEYLQTDAPINPGSSGGALINPRGELIGINTMIYGDVYQGISFAIPSNIVKKFYLETKQKWQKTKEAIK